jgi:hypothetical protein
MGRKVMEFPVYPLLCGRGGNMNIVFKSHYINIHNELKDTVENSIIPYASVCAVDEEHLRDGGSQLRRISIYMTCGRTRIVETNNGVDAEQILLHLLRNTIQPKAAH